MPVNRSNSGAFFSRRPEAGSQWLNNQVQVSRSKAVSSIWTRAILSRREGQAFTFNPTIRAFIGYAGEVVDFAIASARRRAVEL
jgi:hypothetical protein